MIQRVPPVATVSATIRTNSNNSGSVQSQGNLSVIRPVGTSSGASKLPQMRTPFPWMQQQHQKPVGVALVSFKTIPQDQSVQKEMVKPRLNLATHPFPHLAAAAAAATAAKLQQPFKFRTKAELKQMNLTPPPPLPSSSSASASSSCWPEKLIDPIISDEKWGEWNSTFANEWESFIKDLSESSKIKRVCRSPLLLLLLFVLFFLVLSLNLPTI